MGNSIVCERTKRQTYRRIDIDRHRDTKIQKYRDTERDLEPYHRGEDRRFDTHKVESRLLLKFRNVQDRSPPQLTI